MFVSFTEPFNYHYCNSYYLSLSVLTAENPASRYQNVYILDFTGAKDDGSGGDNRS